MADVCSIQLEVRGHVQGVGFRPVVFRLAHELGLRGWVRNHPAGAEIALCGAAPNVERFRRLLPGRLPAAARIERVLEQPPPTSFPDAFEIRSSTQTDGLRAARILPDLATCPECLREILDPADRRYRYPFANCTHCGPRFSLIERLPYDRAHTTMRAFALCSACTEEYHNPADRRFHAQPTACPDCGPALAWTGPDGQVLLMHDEALRAAAEALRNGRIVAVKGVGGFHLMVDARNGDAVSRLRMRKRRDAKPFAVLFPSRQAVEAAAELSREERGWLVSAAAPIVLLRRRPESDDALAEAVAPGLPWIGALLPYTPLHHLLMRDLGFAIVATSGNLTDEPICTDLPDALRRLQGVADAFLTHNRPIARPMDDSVMAVCQGRPLMMRRGRGLAPYSLPMPGLPDGWAGAGGHMKSTLAVSAGGQAVMGPHIGDLDHDASVRLWERSLADLLELHGLALDAAAVDLHPDYASTRAAVRMTSRIRPVQHHHAHIAACMAEHGLEGPVLGVAWDGTGWGGDGTVWGGEFLVATRAAFRRAAWLRPFPLAGGDSAAREPRRCALGVLREMGSSHAPPGFAPEELAALELLLKSGINVASTSSAGRLFDAAASLLGVCQTMTHEGQAALHLEALADDTPAIPYAFGWRGDALDWEPLFREMLASSEAPTTVAARFHETLAAMILAAAVRTGLPDVCLSGGCFQNRRLLAAAIRRLQAAGFRAWSHQDIPPNDAGLCLGQLAVALAAPT